MDLLELKNGSRSRPRSRSCARSGIMAPQRTALGLVTRRWLPTLVYVRLLLLDSLLFTWSPGLSTDGECTFLHGIVDHLTYTTLHVLQVSVASFVLT